PAIRNDLAAAHGQRAPTSRGHAGVALDPTFGREAVGVEREGTDRAQVGPRTGRASKIRPTGHRPGGAKEAGKAVKKRPSVDILVVCGCNLGSLRAGAVQAPGRGQDPGLCTPYQYTARTLARSAIRPRDPGRAGRLPLDDGVA